MKPETSAVHYFRITVHLWLIGFVVSAWPAAEWLWVEPVAPPLPGPPGPFRYLTHAFSTWLPSGAAPYAALLLLVLAIQGVVRPLRWWSALITWVLYTSLMGQAWLAATGGHQLIANVLFWMIPLSLARGDDGSDVPWYRTVPASASFWIIRLQLLIAYGTTALHKLTGDQWTHGQAVAIVATDADYGPSFLANMPFISTMLAYGILFFQLTFPVAVWWRPSRIAWMWMGVGFHLATGITFGILDMALAFLAVYPIWSSGTRAPGNDRPSRLPWVGSTKGVGRWLRSGP